MPNKTKRLQIETHALLISNHCTVFAQYRFENVDSIREFGEEFFTVEAKKRSFYFQNADEKNFNLLES